MFENAIKGLDSIIEKLEIQRKKDLEFKELFHKIWTSQVGTEGYNKKDWQELQRLLKERGINV